MNDLSYVTGRIATRSLAQLRALADRSGVPYPTVLKVARGYTKDPKSSTITLLVRVLRLERRRKRR